jgi:ATP-dependent RNA helicase DeaD
MSFDDLGLDPRVRQALTDVGYESPSRIQSATIPALLAGRSVVGIAQTGTGKTAAFATPILSRLRPDRPGAPPQALVLAPTRELALQVSEAFTRYAAHLPQVHVLPVYGGQSYGPQLAALRRGADIVIGTPGRVIDHLNRGTLDLSRLRFLVLDEADEMLQMGFAEDVEAILADTPEDKQVALFSATMPPAIRRIAQRYLADAEELSVRGETVTIATTRQRYLLVRHHDKLDALTRLLEVEAFEAMIVFVRTKSATEELADKLRARGLSAAAINGDLPQPVRERTVAQLKDGRLDVLVATDVAARGLDVERITHVVNYDIPTDAEAYVHRIGRTGRAGRTGDALVFVTPRERGLLRMIEKATRQPIEEMAPPSVEEVNSTRVSRFTAALAATLESHRDDADFATFRDLLARFRAEQDVDPLDLAAALALRAQDGEAFLLPPAAPGPPRAERPTGSVPRHAGAEPRTGGDSGPRRGRRTPDRAWVPYRIEVGKRHKVQPGAVVGALANEGGLGREDFGHIDIRADHTIVELPATLPEGTLEALRRTRISGRLIDIVQVEETAGRSVRPARPARRAAAMTPRARKPRHRGPRPG